MAVVLSLVLNMLWNIARFGGLVSRHHNKIHDAIGDLAFLVWGNVVCEPVVCDNRPCQMVL